MFCPNCGTPNPETAQTCSKCNFHLKSAAAPKFKGTMLMMNQPGQAPAAPPRPATGSAPSAGASKLKGTMVGVAPPSPGIPGVGTPVPAPSPFGAPAAGAFGGPPAAPPGQFGAPPPAPNVFGGAPPAQPVNPLGGTMAADQAGFGAFGAPQQQQQHQQSPFGAPPPAAQGWGDPQQQQASPFGAPPPAQPAYGAPPAPDMRAYGQPPPQPGFGQPPPQAGYDQPNFGQAPPQQPQQPYGQPPPPQAPYGAPPPAGGFGAAIGGLAAGMQGGLQQMGMAGMAGTNPMAGGATGNRPQVRNALMTWLVPFGVMFGGNIVFSILAGITHIAALSFLGLLCFLAGVAMFVLAVIKMVNELNTVTGNKAFPWIPAIIPIYSLLWWFSILPAEVAKAKQAAGVQQPARSGVMYLLLTTFSFASDLNDIAQRQ